MTKSFIVDEGGNALVEFVVLVAGLMLPVVWFIGISAEKFNEKLFAEHSARYLVRELALTDRPFEQILETYLSNTAIRTGEQSQKFKAQASCLSGCSAQTKLLKVEVAYAGQIASAVMYK